MSVAMTPRGHALQRTFAAAFAALSEHQKQFPSEVTLIAAAVASHLKNAWPMSTTLDAPEVAVAQTTHVDFPPTGLIRTIENGRYELYVLDGANGPRGEFYLHEELTIGRHDASGVMTPEQLDELAAGLTKLAAAIRSKL